MSSLHNKIDFAVVLRVKHANPNGDPLNGNRPRTDYNGYGEITDVCLKRKIRDRLQEAGFDIFVQSDDRKKDDAKHLKERAEKNLGSKFGSPEMAKLACEKWLDVRAFGQLFAYKGKKSKTGNATGDEGDTGISIPIRGPVTVQSAFSVQPIEVTSTQITKSVSGEGKKAKNAKAAEGEEGAGVDGGVSTRSSDTMGMKHRVDDGVYLFCGSMNSQLAERTGFSDEDADRVKQVLPKLFENDASSARPEGSMEVLKVIWWKHNSRSGQYSSAKVHRTLTVNPDGEITLASLPGLEPEIIDGF
jgi:CRISPR-associated protein Csd2